MVAYVVGQGSLRFVDTPHRESQYEGSNARSGLAAWIHAQDS